MKVQITFKSGAQIEFEADDITTKSGRVTGDLTGLEWSSESIDGPRLHWLDANEVVAIVVTRPAKEPDA